MATLQHVVTIPRESKEPSAYENIQAYQITAYNRIFTNTDFIVQKVRLGTKKSDML